jgi:ferritin
MVINENIKNLIQYRIEQEELSYRLYKSMSVWLEYNGFNGASALWLKYAEEEKVHATKAYQFLLDLNIKPVVNVIPLQTNDFKNLQQIIALSYQHEILITTQCNELSTAANKENDYLTLQLALWFMSEQQEELAKTNYWIARLNSFGDQPDTLRLLDSEMHEKSEK